MKKIAFKTLGCRLNQFETDSLVSQFHNTGYQVVDFNSAADVYVINTCTVTHQSDKKSRSLISQALRKQDEAMIIATGCMIDNPGINLQKQNGAIHYIENSRKSSIFSIVDAHFNGEMLHPESLKSGVFDFKPADTTFHTRSLVKIQDGCDNFCSFCIVPFVRGRAVSRPAREILYNVEQVLDYGFKEIVVTGVNIGRYKDGQTTFENLIEKILKIRGKFRVRISSMEPEGFCDKFIDLFGHPKLMPHLHLCLQSGSDNILLKMRRMYTLAEFLKIVYSIRTRYDDFNLTTDVIVGFPGETEEDFNATCNTVREIGFSHIHTFKYSRRRGTRADRMPEQLPEKIKNQRSEIIRMVSIENKRKYRASLIGKTQHVLVEKVVGHTGLGYGELYVPVEFEHPEMKKNMLQEVTLVQLADGEDPVLIGKVKN